MSTTAAYKLSEAKRALTEQFLSLAKQQAARFYRRWHGRMSFAELESAALYGVVCCLARCAEGETPPIGRVVLWMRHAMYSDAPWKWKTLFFSDLENDKYDFDFDPAQPPEEEAPPPVPESIDGYKTPRWLKIAWRWHVQHDCDLDTDEQELRQTLKELPIRLTDLAYQRKIEHRTLAGHVEFTIRFARHALSVKEIAAAVLAHPPCVLAALDVLVREQRVIRKGNLFDVAN